MIELAKKANSEGEFFPVMGTSLGMQALIELECEF